MKTRATIQMLAIHRWILATCLALVPIVLTAQQTRDAANPDGKWEVLDGCRLMTNNSVDGDSFHVLHRNREYIFRLYFVDAAETDPALHERAADQAAYFGLSTNDIPRAGSLAAQFTRAKLAGRELTVITRWQNASGRSKLARYYAVVFVNGKNLAEELAANGLARIYGVRANWPDGPRSTTFINQLKNAELAAREQRRGLWDEVAFARLRPPVGTAGTNAPAVGAIQASKPVDLNASTYDELLKLPGIGPKLAERIMARRPYHAVEELEKVPGIGAKTLERLRPLVSIGPVTP